MEFDARLHLANFLDWLMSVDNFFECKDMPEEMKVFCDNKYNLMAMIGGVPSVGRNLESELGSNENKIGEIFTTLL